MSAVIKIELGKYRGFQKNTEISLAVPNGKPGSGFTILVGPNNTGKSTILATLQKTLISNRDRILIGIDERHDAVATLRVVLESPDGQGAVHFKNTDGAQYRRERSPEALALPALLRYLPELAWGICTVR